jgi:hypothetical protein
MDNIKIDITEKAYEDVDWINLARDRAQCFAVMNPVMNIQVHKIGGNISTCKTTLSFSRRTLVYGVSRLVCHLDRHILI